MCVLLLLLLRQRGFSTMIVVSTEVLLTDQQVVVAVELPELAVDDVEMLVREIVGDLINVVLTLQPTYCLIRTHVDARHYHTAS